MRSDPAPRATHGADPTTDAAARTRPECESRPRPASATARRRRAATGTRARQLLFMGGSCAKTKTTSQISHSPGSPALQALYTYRTTYILRGEFPLGPRVPNPHIHTIRSRAAAIEPRCTHRHRRALTCSHSGGTAADARTLIASAVAHVYSQRARPGPTSAGPPPARSPMWVGPCQ